MAINMILWWYILPAALCFFIFLVMPKNVWENSFGDQHWSFRVFMPIINLMTVILFLAAMIYVLNELYEVRWLSSVQLLPTILYDTGSKELLISLPFYGSWLFSQIPEEERTVTDDQR